MILCDRSIRALLPLFIKDPTPEVYSQINPASLDLCIGMSLITEDWVEGKVAWLKADLSLFTKANPYWLVPGQFALVATEEYLLVPNGYAVELRLKSSRAREGYDHSMAFWFDPGWKGIGTMEIRNCLRYTSLPLWRGLRFGQMIINKLDGESAFPYRGKYHEAAEVEKSKDTSQED